ncbi:MAG: hypothetical protein IH987_07850 [Planctomycetes bacterium]|nr:hypothetical protein [Planctomycetota bacterium]
MKFKSGTIWVLLLASFSYAQTEPKGSQAAKRAAPSVEEILTRLEKRSDGLKDIRCKIHFVVDDTMDLTKQTKDGRILLLMGEPNPKFMIHFEKSRQGGVLGKREWYLFDGRWLHEAIERIEQVTKREITRPGEKRDFFDIETAPIPLPFGQKKEKILKNFTVTWIPPVDGDPENCDHLTCIPKPDSPVARRYDTLDFFIDRAVHLPRRIVITSSEGMEIKTADFPDLSLGSINVGLTDKDFAHPAAWKGYARLVEPLPPEKKGERK